MVLKLLSQTITHKTDVGSVQLDLSDEQAVRNAFETIRTNLDNRDRLDAFDGVTVQPMIRTAGYELIVGSAVDRQFGPVVLFGAGGILVEVFEDRSLALPPLTRTLARRMMERTRIYRVLRGIRGRADVPIDQLELLLVRFSQLVAEYPEIAEIDINPLLADVDQIVSLDARILLASPEVPESVRPRLAIRPYPNRYTTALRLADGTQLLVRAIRPEDEPLIAELHAKHSEQTIRMRFFAMVRMLSRDSLIRLCHLDYDRDLALAALHRDAEGHSHITAVARYSLRPETGVAEFAVVVGDAWQRRGLDSHLMGRLIEIARERGMRQFVGPIIAENRPMLNMVRKLGFTIRETPDNSVVEAVLDLTPPPAGAMAGV